jgi:CheY-like chemotaxis protein
MSRRGDFRILVVDDYKDTAESMAVLIRYWGYDAAVCYDGASVLEIALRYRPMVVLLDIALPGMDGFQVARHLRGRPELGNLVIIGISGYGGIQYRVRALTGGFDHYRVKPVEPAELAELLGRISLHRAEIALPRGKYQSSGVRA